MNACIFQTFLLSIFSFGVMGQHSFQISQLDLIDSLDCNFAMVSPSSDKAFYQDDKYIVRETCQGEWGGSIWFKNKHTGEETSAKANCPLILSKLNGKYLLTTTSFHMMGSSKVLEIVPEEMSVFEKPKFNPETGYTPSDLESQSDLGTHVLLDTAGITILLSFPYDNELYHIYSNQNKLFLGVIESKALRTIDTLNIDLKSFYRRENGVIYGYSSVVKKLPNDQYALLFKNANLLAYVLVKEDEIKVVTRK
ncbi:hypothetical protein [Persicobacter sp. CCB-QB2]|uniref:hypothetical protein n=1 Tax=Persicobacter sp. CCB-QB2 TaxID=1561025 RepID=UPI0006A9DEC3|nr:hypothetical protein [Persicobacter sp. CCB-QB2]